MFWRLKWRVILLILNGRKEKSREYETSWTLHHFLSKRSSRGFQYLARWQEQLEYPNIHQSKWVRKYLFRDRRYFRDNKSNQCIPVVGRCGIARAKYNTERWKKVFFLSVLYHIIKHFSNQLFCSLAVEWSLLYQFSPSRSQLSWVQCSNYNHRISSFHYSRVTKKMLSHPCSILYFHSFLCSAATLYFSQSSLLLHQARCSRQRMRSVLKVVPHCLHFHHIL